MRDFFPKVKDIFHSTVFIGLLIISVFASQSAKHSNFELFNTTFEKDRHKTSQNLTIFIFSFREPGNPWALEKAKENLVNQYLVVGVTERLTEFVAVMEVVLPRYFKGATKRFILGMYKSLTVVNLLEGLQNSPLCCTF